MGPEMKPSFNDEDNGNNCPDQYEAVPNHEEIDLQNPDLFSFLISCVEQIEGDSGSNDDELRNMVNSLKQITSNSHSSSSSNLTEIELASELDKIESRLKRLNDSVDSVTQDEQLGQFMQTTASLWMPALLSSSQEEEEKP